MDREAKGDLPATLRAAIIDSVATVLLERYVFESVAKEMADHMRKRYESGHYDSLSTREALADALTTDLRDVSGDRHLWIQYVDDAFVARQSDEAEDPEVALQRRIAELEEENFNFRKAEILEGNVGYLRFDGFPDAGLSAPTAAAAMNFLAHACALIIDLRSSGGGSASLEQYLAGYFFDEPRHLHTIKDRHDVCGEQFWSAPAVQGPRMLDADLFILTDGRTWSAAEGFADALQHLGRATVVGERTAGGSHLSERKLFEDLNLLISIPFAQVINPVTQTGWEAVGVVPDIEVPQEDALEHAHLQALENRRSREDDAEAIAELDWAIEELNSRLDPFEMSSTVLRRYEGRYGPRRLWVKDGEMYYQREEGPLFKLVAMSETRFRLIGLDHFRIEVVTDETGRGVKLIGHYRSGRTDESPRSETNE
jgi:hypothetical protein